ncbi:MAG: hypothetical protein QXM68_03490 [Candidatus Aenigmatarchaeota archaeon]|nr:hypothetical protein [Candidatus Aenigmarchaeota archaeon]
MKGIALSVIAYMILSLVVLIVILSLIGNKIYPAAKEGYCKFVIGIRSVLPLPTHMKTDIPTICQKTERIYPETIEILSGDPLRISFNIAAYSQACWERTSNQNYNKDVLCYELVLRRVDSAVTYQMVQNYLGTNSNILLTFNDITAPRSIGIIYNHQQNKIQVI